MKTLQGFRTLIFNIAAVTISWLAQNFNLPISIEHQEVLGITLIAIGNITLRFFTKTPIGKKLEPKLVSELNKNNH